MGEVAVFACVVRQRRAVQAARSAFEHVVPGGQAAVASRLTELQEDSGNDM